MEKPTVLKVHGLDLSYFTGKLEGYLRGKGIAYELLEMSTRSFKACGKATGVAQMPQVEWTQGQWLSDTHLMLPFLEQHYTDSSIMPPLPELGFVASLLEDFGDEWLWRPALYYRWAHAPDARLLGDRLARGMMRDVPLPHPLRRLLITNRQRLHFLWLDGWSPLTAPRIQQHYLDTLDALQHHLSAHPFVLGPRPSLADYGLFGSMFRHFASDPTPARIMQNRAPAVWEWVARLWNCKLSDYNNTPWPNQAPVTLKPLFDILTAEFLPYMQANEHAYLHHQRQFSFDSGHVKFKIPVQHYRAWRYQRLRLRHQALSQQVQLALETQASGLRCFLAQPVQQGVQTRIHSLPITPGSTANMVGRSW